MIVFPAIALFIQTEKYIAVNTFHKNFSVFFASLLASFAPPVIFFIGNTMPLKQSAMIWSG